MKKKKKHEKKMSPERITGRYGIEFEYSGYYFMALVDLGHLLVSWGWL